MKKLDRYDVMSFFNIVFGIFFIVHPILFPSFYSDGRARSLLQTIGVIALICGAVFSIRIIRSIGDKRCSKP
jgi:hypothetical protein